MYRHERPNICDLAQCVLPDASDGIVRTILRKKLLPTTERWKGSKDALNGVQKALYGSANRLNGSSKGNENSYMDGKL